MLTKGNHPVSIFSRIHSFSEKDYKPSNTITFNAIEQSATLLWETTFAIDRSYDNNKMFLKLEELHQDYLICLTTKRKLFYYGKWVLATELRNRRKGNIKMILSIKAKSTKRICPM